MFPEQLVVEVTGGCNQECVFCGRTYMRRPLKTMSRELFARIVEEVVRENPTCELWPTFMGEATLLGRRLWEMIAAAKRAGCEKITLNSNGSRLDRQENLDGVFASGVDRFIVSMDAYTRETHRLVRPGRGGRDHWDAIVGGFRALLGERRRRGLERPLLEAQFSCFDENEGERDDFIRVWLAEGAIVKTRPKLEWTGAVPAAALARRAAPYREPCRWAFETCAIQWNGDVVACAVDCEGRHVVGNIAHTTLRELWEGPLARLRATHAARRWDDLPPLCRSCPDWRVKKATVHFPDEPSRRAYEAYVRLGRRGGELLASDEAAPGRGQFGAS